MTLQKLIEEILLQNGNEKYLAKNIKEYVGENCCQKCHKKSKEVLTNVISFDKSKGDYQFRDYLIHLTSAENQQFWVSTNISSVIKDGHLTQMLGVITDVSDRVKRSQEMEYKAKHDGLTGLPNRSHFIEKVEQVFAIIIQSGDEALAELKQMELH